jgi:molecular chaperone DnaK (HSP70)
VLQGERPEAHRNQSIGRFRLNLETGGGNRSKIVVRFDLTLDGTLKVTATQPATGLSQVLTIDNALSRFQADERNRAEARLEAMFSESDELLDEEDRSFRNQWRAEGAEQEEAAAGPVSETAESRFPEAVALLKKAESLATSVESADAQDLKSLCANLKNAMTDGDPLAVAGLSAELDDLLFYVR